MSETESKEGYSHVLKYTGIFGGVQGLNIVVNLVRNKLVALLLGPNGMGLVSIFNTATTFVSQATNLGISFSAVRHISELFDSGDEEKIEHFIKVVRAWSILTAVVGMFVCMVAAPLLSRYTLSSSDYTLDFVMLSPIVAMLAITGGESAILKGARCLKPLATIQIYSVLAALVISVPIYYFFGMKGIVPVLVLIALAVMLITVKYSFKRFPFKLLGYKGVLGEGMEMVRLGVAFVLAGVLGSGAEMLIRSFLNMSGSLETVGLYNAGFMITVTYAGLVFSAMDTDYFPRLSAVNHDTKSVNEVANRQMEVSLLIVSPMLALLMIALPIIIPLLYSNSFSPVVPMAQLAVFSMYLRAMTLCVAYIPLAKGDSLSYLILECIYDVLLVVLIVAGFKLWGLKGTGLALAVSYVLDLTILIIYTSVRYGYRITPQVCRYAIVQLALGLSAYAVTYVAETWLYIVLGAVVVAVSTAISVHILNKKTDVLQKLKNRFVRK